MSIITHDDLANLRKDLHDKRIAFCTGSFDLTHAGHVLFFEACKRQADILVVGLGADAIIRANKGFGRPVLSQHVRMKMVDSLKAVDYCFLDVVSDKADPLGILPFAFGNLRPDVYIVNEDAFDIDTRIKIAKNYGIYMLVLKRDCPSEYEAISATKIIEKIKNL